MKARVLNEAKLIAWLGDTLGWETEAVSLTALAGTHHNFKVSYQAPSLTKPKHPGQAQTSHYLAKIWRGHAGECFTMQSTATLQRHLAQFGLAPQIVAVDPQAGMWLEHWVDDAPMPRCPKLLGQRLAHLHRFPLQSLRKVDVVSQQVRMHLVDEDVPTHHLEPAHPLNDHIFGHMDAQYAHGLGQQVWVDWEYAGITQRGYDLANAIVMNQMHAEETVQCLAEYCAITGFETDVITTGLPYYIDWVDKQNQRWHTLAQAKCE